MSYRILFVLNAFVAVIVGAAFLVVPKMILLQLGVNELYEATFWAIRFLGSAMLALGLALWFAKDANENVQKGMGWALFISTIIGLVVIIAASFSGTAVLRKNEWIPIIVYLLFGLGYAFMLFLKPTPKA
ncbi:MAG TPA: hypothetical protein VLT51_18140 [Anaerolineales bacterium]|nr:hypothetical protein [Anaerolineales bacterium]